MTETKPTQVTTVPSDQGRLRWYAPWMIGVLIVFGVCECVFFASGTGVGVAIVGLIVAFVFWVLRMYEVYWGMSSCIQVLVVLVVSFAFYILVILPGLNSHEAARRMECSSRLKQLGRAIANYEDTYDCFPPVFVADEEGKPMHSWRTMLLPYVEEQKLYEACDLEKSWDSPENRNLATANPIKFQCPSVSGVPDQPKNRTDYVAVVGEDTFWRPDGTPRKMSEITGGLTYAPVLIEINNSDILWHEPRDVKLDDFLSGKLSWNDPDMHYIGGRNVLFGDGCVRFVPNNMTPEQLRQFFSVTESFDVDTEVQWPEPRPVGFHVAVVYAWLATLFLQFVYIFAPVIRR
ncbi:MAG: DUF1559 domain-containing protein [Planctomycetia bacterium]